MITNKKELDKLDIEIYRILIAIGIKNTLRGFEYLQKAIRLIIENSLEYDKAICALYIDVGREFGKSSKAIERSIRYCITEWEANNVNFGIIPKFDHYTVREFIFAVCDLLYLDENN